jgi:uncharacterized protein (DUF427 family)
MATHSGRVRVEDGHKRVRGYLDGQLVFDTVRPKYVWEIPYFPAYYIPVADVRTELLAENGHTDRSPSRGVATYHDLTVDGRTVPNAAWRFADSPLEELRDHLRFEWSALDHWFEEDEEIAIHPRDPYTRIDALRSSRHVVVEVDGVVVAESDRPTILFETGLPPRYYLPMTDVRMELLEPTGSTSGCPYKGTAQYWSVRVGDTVHDDLVWSYPTPLPESAPIRGLLCFYNERVDLVVDGERLPRPKTKFS